MICPRERARLRLLEGQFELNELVRKFSLINFTFTCTVMLLALGLVEEEVANRGWDNR